MHNRPQTSALGHRSEHVTSDSELLAQVDRGDRPAMGLLYVRHSQNLRRIAIGVLRSEPEAEDLVHDLFVKLTTRSRQYEPRFGSVRAWLSAAMRNASIDRYRQLAYRRQQGGAMALSFHSDMGLDASVAPRAVDARRAMQALDGLSEVQRRTIEGLYCEELSCREVARRDRVPMGTVRLRAARAIVAIRAGLSLTDESALDESAREEAA